MRKIPAGSFDFLIVIETLRKEKVKEVALMPDQMMTVEELAEYLKMKTVTIYKHAQSGRIPAFKVGSKWRFKKDTIDKWIEKQEENTK